MPNSAETRRATFGDLEFGDGFGLAVFSLLLLQGLTFRIRSESNDRRSWQRMRDVMLDRITRCCFATLQLSFLLSSAFFVKKATI